MFGSSKEQAISNETSDPIVCPRCKMSNEAGVEFCAHCGARLGPHRKVPWWHVPRRLYDWTLAWAYRPSAGVALFVLSFAESSFFPIPPDVLLMPLVLGNRKRFLRFATVTTVASVAGALLGYLIGFAFIEAAIRLIPGVTQEAVDWLAGEFEARGQWYVFIAALTPIPFKLLTITAGFARMNLVVFVGACILGRATRFYAVATICRLIGPKAVPFIDRYFNWLALLFAVLLVGGFVVVKHVF